MVRPGENVRRSKRGTMVRTQYLNFHSKIKLNKNMHQEFSQKKMQFRFKGRKSGREGGRKRGRKGRRKGGGQEIRLLIAEIRFLDFTDSLYQLIA